MASPTFQFPTFAERSELNLEVPLGGLVDTPHLGALPREAATIMQNFHFDRLAIERRKGRVLIGNKIDEAGHLLCNAGYQFRKRDGTIQLLRVQGSHLYRLVGAAWVGAVSGNSPADATDVIGNDTGLGRFFQYNDKLYWCDGGALRSYYDGTSIFIWGFQGGALPAGTADGPASGGALTIDATYAYVWTLFNPTTGVETNPSAVSPEFKVGGAPMTLPKLAIKAAVAGGSMTSNKKYEAVWTMVDPVSGDESAPSPVSSTFKTSVTNKQRKIKIGPFTDWDSAYTTINIYRSKANAPGSWFLEDTIVGIVNFKTVAQNYTLKKSDAALGAAAPVGGDQSEDITIGPWAGWSPDYIGFTTLRVYRTPANIKGEYFLDTETTGITNFDTVPVTLTLSKSDSELEADNQAQFDNDPPPAILYGRLYQEQVVAVAADDPTALIWSKVSNPAVFPLSNKSYADRDSGDPIAAIFVMVGRLYVVKRSGGVFGALPDGFGGYALEKITGDWGCAAPFSVIEYGTFAFWLDQRGAPQFDGQTVMPFSDKAIRQTFARFARSSAFATAVGVHDPQPDKQYLRWLVHDPDDGFTYHLIFDLSRGAWFTELAGDGVAAGGGRDRVAWIVRDTDGRQWVYTADDQGRCFRLRTDENSVEVWDDAGESFTSDWMSSWMGDGIATMLPLYIDGERQRSATGKISTTVAIRFYRDINMTSSPKSQSFPLFDSTSTPHQSRPFRMRLNSQVCRRFAIRITLSGSDADFSLMRLTATAKPIGKRLRGS